MAWIEVVKKGAFVTVQDAGRIGRQSEGVRPSGACDAFSMRLANFLAGNRNGEAVLEITLAGGEFRFSECCAAAFSGADMPVTVNGVPVPREETFLVPKDGIVSVGTAQSGLRGYLAAAGGIRMPVYMGSRSGEKTLAAGDRLEIRPKKVQMQKADGDTLRKTASRVRLTEHGAVRVLRYVPGPQEERFCLADFGRNIYTVAPESDRMGVRMTGEKLASNAGYDILSDGIAPGAIQITGGGLPVVMLAAHQTTGGYAKIGTVIRTDLKHIANLRPGESVCFSAVTPDEARGYLLDEEQRLKTIFSEGSA